MEWLHTFHPRDRLESVIDDNGQLLVLPASIDASKLAGMLKPPARPVSVEAMSRNHSQKRGFEMIGLDTERPGTIAIGTNEHIGTDPANLLLALAGVMTDQWKAWAISPTRDGKAAVAA
jgi:hypothetical protein